jgi:serine/threonine protein kinase
VDILAAVRPANFPKLLYKNLFKNNPETDEPLAERLYVTIEEFIDGPPLENIWQNYRGDEKRVATLALGVANALMPLWVHPQRYVHRDIKPPNILIRPNDEVVVIDLGVVRETGAKGLTQTGFVAPLTPGFAAPEQYRDERALISFKTDFFAIGVVMYLLMSGTHPFHWDNDMDRLDVQLATLNHIPKPLSELVQASQPFSDFVEKAMKKAQFERQRTPDIFVEQLEALCSLNKN